MVSVLPIAYNKAQGCPHLVLAATTDWHRNLKSLPSGGFAQVASRPTIYLNSREWVVPLLSDVG